MAVVHYRLRYSHGELHPRTPQSVSRRARARFRPRAKVRAWLRARLR